MEEEQKQNTQQAKEEHAAPSPKHMSIRSILGGDILANDFFKRQTRLLILIMILTVLYIDNRYSSQQELIEIDKLKKDLVDIKYDALTRSSELMEKSRQSRIKKFFQELIRDHHRKHKVVELIILMYIGKEARHYYAEPIVMYGPRGMFARGTATEILSGNKYRTGISRVIEHKTVNLVSFLVESPVAEQIVTEPLS